jgi:hypothetical protein
MGNQKSENFKFTASQLVITIQNMEFVSYIDISTFCLKTQVPLIKNKKTDRIKV